MGTTRALALTTLLIVIAAAWPAARAEATGSAAPDAAGPAALADEAYNGMEGFRLAASKHYFLKSFLEENNLPGEAKEIEARRAEIALSQNDWRALLEIRASGASAPADLSPLFRPDAIQRLSPERFAAAAGFFEILLQKNKGAGYASAFLNLADFEFSLDAAYAGFQRALDAFEPGAAASEAAIEKLKSNPASAAAAAYVASDLIIAANTLAQNTKVAGYYKKYAPLLETLSASENMRLLLSTYGALLAAHRATGDAQTAEAVEKLLMKLRALDEVTSAGVLGMLEARIEKPEAVYETMGEKSLDLSILDIPSGGGAAGSYSPPPTTYNLTVSNMSAVQFEELSAALWRLEGYEATGEATNEKNTQKAEIITAASVTAAGLAAFLNAQKFDGFILNVQPSGETEIAGKATGAPREKFDFMAAAFNVMAAPSDVSPAGGALSLIRELSAALAAPGPQPALRELLYANLEAALAKMSGEFKTFRGSDARCEGREAVYPRLSGLCLAQRALGSAAAGDYPRAAVLSDSAAALFASDQAVVSLSRAARENSIAARLASGKFGDPRQAALQLEELAADAAGEELLNIRITMANARYASGDYEAAYAAYEDAEAAARDFTGMEQARALILLGKGNCRIMQLRHSDAIAEYSAAAKAAEAAASPLLAAAAYSHLANVDLYNGDYPAAEDNARRAADIADKYEYARLKWQSLYTAARALDARDKSQDALDAYLAAIARIETAASLAAAVSGPATLDLDAQDVFRYAASLCARMNKPELALQILERGKTAALREQFEQSNVKFHNPAAQKAAEDVAAMKTEIAAAENAIQKESGAPASPESGKEASNNREQLQDAQRQFIKYVNSLGSKDSGLAALYNIEPVELVKVRKKLPAGMAVLYYLAGDTSLYIFYVRADSIGFKETVIEPGKIEALVRRHRNLISQPPAAGTGSSATQERTVNNTREASGALYDLLIKPVSSELQGIDTIAIIPSGVLNFIPYEALAPESAPDDYLIKKYAIFYLDTLSAIEKDAPADGRKNKSLYAFGNADQTLPGAEREVEAISKEFAKPNIYLRGDATEEKAKEVSEKSGIFHFATHGSLDFKDISKSFITLSPGGGDDGRLTLEEVWGYWWGDTTLVALSACNTATGDLIARGKVLNPAGAFLNAGAPSVLATLWSVDDTATASLMEKFYKYLSGMKKVDALRAAQLDLLKDPRVSHPYYWAPFTLIGDWR